MKMFYRVNGEVESRQEITTLENFMHIFKRIKEEGENMGGTVWREIVIVDDSINDETFGHPCFSVINKRVI